MPHLKKVKQSTQTISLLNTIRTSKTIIQRIKNENIILKKLCRFGGKIQGKSQLKLNNNSLLLAYESSLLADNKSFFEESYEIDFKNSQMDISLNNPSEIYSIVDNRKNEKGDLDASSLKSEKAKSVYSLLNQANENGVNLGTHIMREVEAIVVEG
jgi:hypothetical protein